MSTFSRLVISTSSALKIAHEEKSRLSWEATLSRDHKKSECFELEFLRLDPNRLLSEFSLEIATLRNKGQHDGNRDVAAKAWITVTW